MQFVLFRVREGLSSTEEIAIRSLPCTRGVSRHGRNRNSCLFRIREGFSSTEGIVICELPCTERGYQAGKESQFVLFRIREGFSSTEGITNPVLFRIREGLSSTEGITIVLFRIREGLSTGEVLFFCPRFSGQRTVSLGILSQSYFHGTHHSNFVIDEFLYPIYKNSNRNLLIPSVLVESLDKFPLIRRMIFWGPFVFMTKNIPPSVIR